MASAPLAPGAEILVVRDENGFLTAVLFNPGEKAQILAVSPHADAEPKFMWLLESAGLFHHIPVKDRDDLALTIEQVKELAPFILE